jgi:ribosomal protein S27AE
MDNYSYIKRICPNCNVSILDPHPNVHHDYDKCGFCGYCELKDLERLQRLKERQSAYEPDGQNQ